MSEPDWTFRLSFDILSISTATVTNGGPPTLSYLFTGVWGVRTDLFELTKSLSGNTKTQGQQILPFGEWLYEIT